jgi:hypothetical protein
LSADYTDKKVRKLRRKGTRMSPVRTLVAVDEEFKPTSTHLLKFLSV